MNRYTVALAALSAVLFTAAPALAASMMAMQNTTAFAAPDQNSAVVANVPAGVVYESPGCNNGWCAIQTSAGTGYVISSTLGPVAPPPPTQAANPPPPNNNGFPGFSFNFGNNNNPPPRPPHRPGGGNGGGFGNNDDDMVCFYERNNFEGKSFCAEPGDASDQLPRSWNDRISSIEVYGRARVEVCSSSDLEGTCSEIRRDTPRLSSRLNDRISSFEVY